jgi:hypothetical protein
MKLVLIDTDSYGTFWLDGHRHLDNPVLPGGSAKITVSLQSEPIVFVRLCLGPRCGVSVVGTDGILPVGSQGPAWDESAWRIDEVAIDDAPVDHRQLGCGVGNRLFMCVTNISKAPAHFYASWECEDVQ